MQVVEAYNRRHLTSLLILNSSMVAQERRMCCGTSLKAAHGNIAALHLSKLMCKLLSPITFGLSPIAKENACQPMLCTAAEPIQFLKRFLFGISAQTQNALPMLSVEPLANVCSTANLVAKSKTPRHLARKQGAFEKTIRLGQEVGSPSRLGIFIAFLTLLAAFFFFDP